MPTLPTSPRPAYSTCSSCLLYDNAYADELPCFGERIRLCTPSRLAQAIAMPTDHSMLIHIISNGPITAHLKRMPLTFPITNQTRHLNANHSTQHNARGECKSSTRTTSGNTLDWVTHPLTPPYKFRATILLGPGRIDESHFWTARGKLGSLTDTGSVRWAVFSDF